MKIAVVRGAFLNQFEMQSFAPLAKEHKLTAFSSLKPIDEKVGFPVVKLLSPMDLLKIPIFRNRKLKRYLRGALNRIFVDAHYLWGLERNLQGFDIAHCAETYFHFTQQCLKAKNKGWVKKVVCSVSETIPFNNEGIRGRKEFKKRAREKVDLFLVRTNLAKKALMAEGCDPEKIVVVPHGVDLKKFKIKNEKVKTTIKNEKITILFVGRLEEEKGVKELLGAFRQITQDHQNIKTRKHKNTRTKKQKTDNKEQIRVKLKMVGEGSLRGWIKQWIRENQQSDNVVIEQYPYQKMPKVYQQADIFVLPSKKTKNWQEHFGMVLIEAMASGLPVVATKCGAIPEVVGQAGLLVDQEDEEELYQALKKLVKSRSLRKKLGKMGRKRVEKYFDSQKVAGEIEKVYQEAGTEVR